MRRALDGLEAHLAEAQARHERLRVRQERVARLMVAVRAGADHLAEQLATIVVPSGTVERPLGDVASSLSLCRSKLGLALHELRDVAAVSKTALADPAKLEVIAPLSVEESGALLTLLLPENQQQCEETDEGEEKAGEEAEVTSRATLKQRSAERRVSASKKERSRR